MIFYFSGTGFKWYSQTNKWRGKVQIYIDDIEEITMLDRLPSGIRTNGVGASTYNLGNFSIDGYGKCKLYLYFENPNCISIKLKDGRYIFFNSKSNDETLRYYAELQKLLEK